MNIAKRPLSAVVSLLLALGLAVIVSGPADAAAKKRVDRRACTSKAEYLAIRHDMTVAQVRALVDSWGTQVRTEDNGHYAGAWVEDGHWDSKWVDASYQDAGHYDESGNWVPGEWVEAGYYEDVWVDESSYNEKGGSWVSMVDTHRVYRKCRDFQRGKGRVVLNFDNYTSASSGLRVFTKASTNTWSGYGRVSHDGLPEKTPSKASSRPSRPRAPSQSEAPHAGNHRADALAKANQAGAVLVVR